MEKTTNDSKLLLAEKQEDTIDFVKILLDMWRGWKHLWWITLVFVLICPFIVCGYVYLQHAPMYEAYTSFTVKVVSRSTADETDTVYNYYYDQEATEQLDRTFSYIVNSDRLLEEVKVLLETERIEGRISAESVKDTNLFVLHVYSATPENAKALLEAVVAVYPDVVKFVVGEVVLDIIEEPVALTTPYNQPNYLKNGLLGVGIGALLSCGILFLYVILRKTVKQPEDIKDSLDISCLGILPKVIESSKKHNHNADDSFSENIRSIALKIDNIMKKSQMKELLITSTVPAEGKTRLSVNLALALAKRGRRVLLLDGDLRKPTVYKNFFLPKDFASLEEVLMGKKAIKDALQYLQEDKLFFLGSLQPAENPGELIASEQMRQLLTELKEVFDYILIDAPPCEMMADVTGYWECVDAVVYTIRSDWAATDRILHSMRELAEQGNKLIGFVLNGMDESTVGYGKYGYGKYGYGKYGYGKYGYGKYGKYGYGKENN